MTEELAYTVESEHDEFEIRRYPSHFLAQVEVEGDFMRAGNVGFGPLLRFISGNNARSQSIAMTAPVIQETTAPETHTVSFVLPAGFSASNIPAPNNARVSVVEVAPKRVAVRRFSGGWRASRFEKNEQALLADLDTAGLSTRGHAYFARFDPPWKPGFLKRNEVLVDLAN